MSWSSLVNRISTLPVIIAGPILRRVERHTVSVWLALREPAASTLKVVLKVFDENNLLFFQGEYNNPPAFGQNLRICVVTAGPVTTGVYMQSGVLYKYNIELYEDGQNLTGDLFTSGILTNGNYQIDLSYDGSGLPSFSIPPADLNLLKVVHASCRKPHGGELDGKYDALYGLDLMIANAYQSASFADERPHLLFLTGDQIYADDVADTLLFMLRDANTTIMGWDEDLPSAQGVISNTDYRLKPGERNNLRNETGFTSTDDKSHLFKLGEFYAMYLFCWSDVLWPANLPTPVQQETNGDDKEDFLLEAFRFTLKEARRALANVSSFMILDDHEVTDDFNLDMNWYQGIFGDGTSGEKLMGIRVVQNALSAYAIFQDWGNVPEKFFIDPDPGITSPGEELIINLANLRNDHSVNSPKWTSLKDILLPDVSFETSGAARLVGGFDWDYRVFYYDIYQFIVLNTRTRRFFPKKGIDQQIQTAGLISREDMVSQVDTYKLDTIPETLTFIISPAPFIGSGQIESLLRLGPLLRQNNRLDSEPWVYNRGIYEAMLYKLSYWSRVVILSGDVHYGFTRYIYYIDGRQYPERKSRIVQFVSSPLKNEAKGPWGSRSAYRFDEGSYPLLSGSKPIDVLAFDLPHWLFYNKVKQTNETVYESFGMRGPDLINQHPAFDILENIRPLYKIDFNRSTPYWFYRIMPVEDKRYFLIPGASDPIKNVELSRRSYWAKNFLNNKNIIGINHISCIQLTWDNPKSVQQSFWYSGSGDDNTLVNFEQRTLHIVNFDEPINDIPYE